MFKLIQKKLEARREKRRREYADEYGFMDRDKLEQLRDQQSPLRGMSRGARRR